jgi:hypothetical protein
MRAVARHQYRPRPERPVLDRSNTSTSNLFASSADPAVDGEPTASGLGDESALPLGGASADLRPIDTTPPDLAPPRIQRQGVDDVRGRRLGLSVLPVSRRRLLVAGLIAVLTVSVGLLVLATGPGHPTLTPSKPSVVRVPVKVRDRTFEQRLRRRLGLLERRLESRGGRSAASRCSTKAKPRHQSVAVPPPQAPARPLPPALRPQASGGAEFTVEG